MTFTSHHGGVVQCPIVNATAMGSISIRGNETYYMSHFHEFGENRERKYFDGERSVLTLRFQFLFAYPAPPHILTVIFLKQK